MNALNGWDRRDNEPKLAKGTVWYLRHSKGFTVKITAIEGGLVRFRHLQRQHNRHKTQKRPTAMTRYSFLQVYKPK